MVASWERDADTKRVLISWSIDAARCGAVLLLKGGCASTIATQKISVENDRGAMAGQRLDD